MNLIKLNLAFLIYFEFDERIMQFLLTKKKSLEKK